MSPRLITAAALSLAVVTFGAGCSNNKTNAERASLLKQNQDMAAQLEQERAARAAAEARANTPPIASAPDTGATQAPAGAPEMGNPLPDATGDVGGGLTRGVNEMGEATLTISSDVLFDSGKATLKPAARTALDKAAAIIRKEYSGHQLRIEGYTDPNPVRKSGWDDNWDLGSARANAVRKYLATKGVGNMYIASFGDTKLKSTKNLALDRRVEIVVVRGGK
jgi:flagellar motor protein MotB